MIGRTISHYKILEKLQETGMGVVYKAEDTKLKRTVALKFLPPELKLEEDFRERLIREARAASALQHNNICTIHEIGETKDGQMFICMDYYEGETLKSKTSRGALPVDEAVDIAIQVARGLSEAHRNGIVHRDIKPANLILTIKSEVKIIDFGLAKLADSTDIIKMGSTAGTVAYMSPEQARGEAVDNRTDIWSLGVVLYEMLAGRIPFKGEYDAAIIYSILNQDPVPVSELCPEVPLELKHVVEKAMAKNIEERYQDVAHLIDELMNLEAEFEHKAFGDHSIVASTSPSVAVLPFVDMSPKKDQEYFCDGMSEEVINALAKVEGMSVVSRTSSFSFKGRNEDVREIGGRLNVGTILDGSVRKAGKWLRITAQLISVADGYHLWSEQYDRELEDVFTIQEEIARNIVQALKVELSEKEERALKKAATQDVQAYDFYLRGKEFFALSRKRNLKRAIDMFSQAIKRDPNYALAYAGKADCYSFLYMQVDCEKSNLEYAMTASGKALELDPDLAEAHAARGVAVSLSERYEEAEKEFETAIQLNPKLFEAHYFYARSNYVQGKLEKAAASYERACRVNPGDFQAPVLLAQTYRGLNLPKKAEAAHRRGLAVVEQHLQLNPDDARAFYFGANCLVVAGEQEKGLDWANRALDIDPKDPLVLYGVACVYSLLGKVQEAIDLVERALKAGFAHRKWMEIDSDLDSIRDHPRFKTLLNKL